MTWLDPNNRTWLDEWLVDGWQRCWRFASVKLHAIVILIAGLYEAMPVLSPQIAAMLPAASQAKAIGVYALIGLVVRLLKQKPKGA